MALDQLLVGFIAGLVLGPVLLALGRKLLHEVEDD